MVTVVRRLPTISVTVTSAATSRWRVHCRSFYVPFVIGGQTCLKPFLLSRARKPYASVFFHCSALHTCSAETAELDLPDSSKQGQLKSGLYLVGTPIGNLEDITLRALRVLKSADVILSEDTRHSGKLLHYYGIKTPLGEIVALISDAGTPGISDPGMELAKVCIEENISVIPVPGPSALVTALSASGLPIDEFTFVGFLPKHNGSRRERLLLSSNQTATQIFFVPPHKLLQFLEETSLVFSDSRRCVIAREMTKIHEEAVKLVAEGTSMKRKEIYSLALRKFSKQDGEED